MNNKLAINYFPISNEDARDVDELKETYPNKKELRNVLEDYFGIYTDNAEFSPQEFYTYFKDYVS